MDVSHYTSLSNHPPLTF
jgi:pre-mRNA-splicing factor CDC5/CEF1